MSASSSAAEASPGAPAAVGSGEGEPEYLNRELSRLDFYGRVLELAQDEGVPLLERVKFLAIFSQFVDEFFQVQVAGLKDQVKAGITATGPDGRSPAEQLRAIRDRVEDLLGSQAKIFLTDVGPRLAEAGVRLCDWESLDEEDRAYLVQLVNGVTGLSGPDAERRVDNVIAGAKTAIARSRRSAIIAAFSVAASILLGAVVAWFAACEGGRHRDGAEPGWLTNRPLTAREQGIP